MGLSRNKVAVPEGAAGTPPFWSEFSFNKSFGSSVYSFLYLSVFIIENYDAGYLSVRVFYMRKSNISDFGGLAQLARALAWHARGQRFESVILHQGHTLFNIYGCGHEDL